MKFNCTIVSGKIIFSKSFWKFIEKQKDGKFTIEFKKYEDTRTEQQNKAIHVYCGQVAKSLNENGITAHQIFSESVESFWTPTMIKEIWKKVQKSMYATDSTTELKKNKQIDEIHKTLHRVFAERSGGMVDIPFPNEKNKNGH